MPRWIFWVLPNIFLIGSLVIFGVQQSTIWRQRVEIVETHRRLAEKKSRDWAAKHLLNTTFHLSDVFRLTQQIRESEGAPARLQEEAEARLDRALNEAVKTLSEAKWSSASGENLMLLTIRNAAKYRVKFPRDISKLPAEEQVLARRVARGCARILQKDDDLSWLAQWI